MKKTWFSAAVGAAGSRGEIAIYDEIGSWGVRAGAFRDALAGMGGVKAIDLRINSPGGDVFDGVSIYNMLAYHPAEITVTVEGLAASIASLIAMAGDKVVMPENTMMMVHDPLGVVVGTANDMISMADTLNKIRDGMVTSYASKTGLDPEAIVEIMRAETWLTAAEAKDKGFADEVAAPVKIAARFDLSRFRGAPEGALAVYDPDGDGDDDALEAIGYIGEAIDNMTAAIGCLTGTGDPDDAEPAAGPGAAVMAALRKARAGHDSRSVEKQEPAAASQQQGAEAVAAARDEILQIVAACQIAGFPESAAAFIESGADLKQATSVLQAWQADRGRGPGPEISARHNPVAVADSASWGRTLDKLNARIGRAGAAL